jgi:hypothetical protein
MHHAMRGSAALAVAALLGAITAPAQADKPAQPDPQARPKAAEPAKREQATNAAQPAAQPARTGEAAGERGSAGHDKATEAHAARGKSAEAHAAAPGQADKARGLEEASGHSAAPAPLDDKLRGETRAKRQQERRDQLKLRYGLELLQRAPIRAELKTHAWRMARLERMQTLAAAITNAAKRQKTTERLNKLIAKENARHERQLEQLRHQGETTAVALRAEGMEKPDHPDKPDHAATPAAAANALDKQADKAGGSR